MKKNTKNLIIAIVLIIIGFLGAKITKYLPLNFLGLAFLIFLSACKIGGFILLIVSLIKVFSKEKLAIELGIKEKIIKRKKLLIFSIVFFVLGLLLCFSSYLMSYLCGKSDNLCSLLSVVLGLFVFVPTGIVLVIIGSLKLYKFFKIKNA